MCHDKNPAGFYVQLVLTNEIMNNKLAEIITWEWMYDINQGSLSPPQFKSCIQEAQTNFFIKLLERKKKKKQ